jgi:hypothetical protein
MALYAKCSFGLLLMLVVSEVSYGRVHPEERNGPFHRLQKRDSPDEPDQLTNADATSKLLRDIFNYDHRYASPIVAGESVSIGLSYLCGRLDEKEHVLKSRAWARTQWTDPRLQWEPSQYNGIKEVRVDPWYIWTPDLVLYNAVESSQNYDWWVNAVVYYNGTVFYAPPTTFTTVCRPSKAGRSHQCTLKSGSWTYDSVLMPLKMLGDGFDNKLEIDDCPYTISNLHSTIESNKYDCCENPYQTFTLTFTIQPNNYD